MGLSSRVGGVGLRAVELAPFLPLLLEVAIDFLLFFAPVFDGRGLNTLPPGEGSLAGGNVLKPVVEEPSLHEDRSGSEKCGLQAIDANQVDDNRNEQDQDQQDRQQ
jgi:hypothetical protein